MLHSLQYYACCYALLCLLHQQQRAASLTIIIDGATTNEWATQDEYRRMLEASSDLETALSQQQQQTEQELDQQQPPPGPPLSLQSLNSASATALRRLYERASTPQRYCGKHLVEMLDVVCHGEYYGGPQIAEPIIKTKRASRLRALSSSSPSSLSSSQSTHSSFKSPPEQAPFSSASPSSSPKQRVSSHQLSIVQSDELGDEISNYPGEIGSSSQSERSSRLQQIQMMLPAHLQAGDGGSDGRAQQSIQTGTDNNNDGDTITINSNPSMTGKSRNRYNRMLLSRRIRGVTDECCKRPCDLDTMRTYCKVPTK